MPQNYFPLFDGRAGGYDSITGCGQDGCNTGIDCGIGSLCGSNPALTETSCTDGCSGYFCSLHKRSHTAWADGMSGSAACGYAGQVSDHRFSADPDSTNDVGDVGVRCRRVATGATEACGLPDSAHAAPTGNLTGAERTAGGAE